METFHFFTRVKKELSGIDTRIALP
jgi:hypothetical protein